MKKLLIIALFVFGMYNAPVFAMAQEIILSELYSFIPYDNPKDDGRGGGPDPTQIQASINGDQLSIDMGTDAPAYAEVIDPETGEECPVGVQGELCNRGYNAMRGHYKNPQASAETIDENG